MPLHPNDMTAPATPRRRDFLATVAGAALWLPFSLGGHTWGNKGVAGDGLSGRVLWRHSSGAVYMVAHYEDGWLHGCHRGWYEDGQRWFDAFFVRGLRLGRFRSWYAAGQPQVDGEWEDEYCGVERTWAPDGRLISTIDLSSGSGTYEAWDAYGNGLNGLLERGRVSGGKAVGTWTRYVAGGGGPSGAITVFRDCATGCITSSDHRDGERVWSFAVSHRGITYVRQPRPLPSDADWGGGPMVEIRRS